MKILKTVQKIPGGLMIVPLLLGVLINTLCGGWLWDYFKGTFTQYLWYGSAMPILAVFLFCTGTQITVREAGTTVYKGVVLTVTKVGVGIGVGLLIQVLTGGNGVLGISVVAIIAALANSNGGLYSALAGQFGKEDDVAAVAILSINDGPFFTMVALGIAGYNIPFATLLGCIIPIAVGCLLGNLDKDIQSFCKPGVSLMIPFFAFPLGSNLTLASFVTAGISGIVLGLGCVIITGFAGYGIYKLLKMERPQVGGAIGTAAGNSASTPAALLAVGAITEEISAAATAQISACIIVTAILCPLFVTWLDSIERKKHPDKYLPKPDETAVQS